MRKIVITHLSDPRKGETLEFAGEVLRIGRGEWNELIFAEPQHTVVSRNHAEISRRESTYVLTDNSSSTGTYVNDEKISHVALKTNDVIRFGRNGPEIRVIVPASDLKSTVVVPPPREMSAPSSGASAPKTVITAGSHLEPHAQGRDALSAASSAARRPSAPAASRAMTVALPPTTASQAAPQNNAVSSEVEQLRSQVQRMTRIAGAAGAVLLVLLLFAMVRVLRVAGQLGDSLARMDKLDAVTGEMLQKLSAMDPKAMEQVIQQKSRELDQKGKELEQRAREMEQKFAVQFEQKSREVDAQFDTLGQAFPQIRSRMEEVRRRRKK